MWSQQGMEESTVYIDQLQDFSDDELQQEWKATVGNWILSRDDIYTTEQPEEGITSDGQKYHIEAEPDEIVESILTRVIAGKDTPHGFSV